MSFLNRAMKKMDEKFHRSNDQPAVTASGSVAASPAPPAPVEISKEKPLGWDDCKYMSDGRERLFIKNPLLQECDTLVLIDDSGSMGGLHWSLVKNELSLVADVLTQNDPDGIDLFFLNHESTEAGNFEDGRPATGYLKIQNPEYIVHKFNKLSPCGGTPTPRRLGLILEAYVSLCERMAASGQRPRPLNIIVWTDGDCPRDALKGNIVSAARRLDAIKAPQNQCGIQFFQVGNVTGIDTWLQSLDDELQKDYGLSRDMVDTKKYGDIVAAGGFNAKSLITIMVGALSKRHDRMN